MSDEKIELWCCAHCEHEFFAVSSECPKCSFGSYRLLNIVAPAQVVVGAFRITRSNKACSGRKASGRVSSSECYVALRR